MNDLSQDDSIFPKECTLFVTVYSNTQSMPACQVVALEPSSDLVHPIPLAFLVEPARQSSFCFVLFCFANLSI